MKALITLLGICSLALAAAGAFLPLLPTVPFVLLAAACFAKSSPRFHAWLLNSPAFGPILSHWQQSRSIPRRAKLTAIITIVCSGALSLYLIEEFTVKVALVIMLCIPLLIVQRLPSSETLASTLLPDENK